jgi:dolichol-phosphate mannosyltransferase
MSARPAAGERPRRLRLLLPAFNEEGNLGDLLVDARDTFVRWGGISDWGIVVVDDGSSDGTARVATSVPDARVTLLPHGVNRGLGAAMRTGIEHALATMADDDLLVSMDSDHTHPPELIPSMVALADEGADLVIASRYQPGAKIAGLVWWRRLISDAASLVFRVLFPCGARDYTCGYRVYRVGLLRWGSTRYGPHFLNQRGFSVMVDVLLKLRRHARRIAEVPLDLRYDRKRGASKMKVMRTIGTTLRLLGRRFVGNPRGP